MYLKKLLQNLLGLARLRTSLLIVFIYILGIVSIAADYGSAPKLDFQGVLKLILGVFVMMTCYLNAAALNDLADLDIDRVNIKNDSERPLLAGKISKKSTIAIISFSAVLAILVSLIISPISTGLVLAVLFFNYIYSFKPVRLSYRGLFPIALLPIVYVAFPILLAAQVTNRNLALETWALLIGMYLAFMSRLFLKDFRDIQGDQKFGKRTFLLRYGKLATIGTSIGFLIGSTMVISVAVLPNDKHSLLALLFLNSMSVSILVKLNSTENFLQQGPLLSVFGRLQSGGIFVLIAHFVLGLSQSDQIQTDGTVFTITVLTYFSAQETFRRAKILAS